MNRKKAYVSPQVIRVKLDPSQAVLSQCISGQSKIKDSNDAGQCTNDHGGCKKSNIPGDTLASS